MSRFLLIRHASVDGLGDRVVGRAAGVHLNRQGKLEACALAERLSDSGVQVIYSSPRERAQETAEVLDRRLHVGVVLDDDLDELDYGDWTGRRFSDLNAFPEWAEFNHNREHAAIPGGESMTQTAARAARALERTAALHPHGTVALVTHADWIRTAICHSLAIPFAAMLKFQVPTASVTVLEFDHQDLRILAWNDGGSCLTSRQH